MKEYTMSKPLDDKHEDHKINLDEIVPMIAEMLERGDWVNISLTSGNDSFVDVITVSKN